MANLRKLGYECQFIPSSDEIATHRALVVCKAHGSEAVRLAERAREKGIKVIFDLCDNVLASYHPVLEYGLRASVRRMILLADRVTTPSQTMAEAIGAAAGATLEKFMVVPDALEEIATVGAGTAEPSGGADIERAERFLTRQGDTPKCIWFGSSVGRLSGFVDLDRAVKHLERFSSNHPVSLTIISDKRWRYWIHKRNWSIPTQYIEWNLASFAHILQMHDVAIIPVGINEFTIGKSINRPATALLAGLGVIADAIPSYVELSPFIQLENWQEGLRHYAGMRPGKDPRIALAKTYLEEHYGNAANGAHWARVLADLGVDATN